MKIKFQKRQKNSELMSLEITLSYRSIYCMIAFVLVICLGFGVYAVDPGHTTNEIDWGSVIPTVRTTQTDATTFKADSVASNLINSLKFTASELVLGGSASVTQWPSPPVQISCSSWSGTRVFSGDGSTRFSITCENGRLIRFNNG